jgi:hypothetical protein
MVEKVFLTFDFNLSGMPVLNANINPKGFTDNHLITLSGLMIYKGIFSYFCTSLKIAGNDIRQ